MSGTPYPGAHDWSARKGLISPFRVGFARVAFVAGPPVVARPPSAQLLLGLAEPGERHLSLDGHSVVSSFEVPAGRDAALRCCSSSTCLMPVCDRETWRLAAHAMRRSGNFRSGPGAWGGGPSSHEFVSELPTDSITPFERKWTAVVWWPTSAAGARLVRFIVGSSFSCLMRPTSGDNLYGRVICALKRPRCRSAGCCQPPW